CSSGWPGGISMDAIAGIGIQGAQAGEGMLAWREFRASPIAVAALGLFAILITLAVFAPWLAPQDPYDLSQLSIMDNKLPPASHGLAGELYVLGTDDQGRDMLSAIIYGLRLSLFVGFV